MQNQEEIPKAGQNQEEIPKEGVVEAAPSTPGPEFDGWENCRDAEIMQQQSAILAEEAAKIPFVGDKASAVHTP